MFVKIIEGSSDSIYQCTGVVISPSESDSCIWLTIEQAPGQSINYEVNKKFSGQVGVYLMNDHGRTIDTIFHKLEDLPA